MNHCKNSKKRTNPQNRSLHVYFRLLAEKLNEAGLDQRKVLKPSVDIPWTEEAIKDRLWRPVQEAMIGKLSTTELTTSQVNKVYETLNRFISIKFGIFTPFPHN